MPGHPWRISCPPGPAGEVREELHVSVSNMRLALTLVVFLLGTWAIASVLASRVGFGAKLRWIAAIVALPVVGLLAWMFAGPKPSRTRRR